MSVFSNNEISRFVKLAIQGIEEQVLDLPPRPGERCLVEYAHMSNFEQLVKAKQNPALFPGVEVTSLVGFTEESQRVVLEAVLAGNTPECACRVAGILPRQWQRWMSLAEREIEPFLSFMIEVKKASGLAEAAAVDELLRGRKTEAAKTWLSKLGGPAWKDQPVLAQTNININNNIPLEKMKPHERAAYLAELEGQIVIE